MSLKDAEAKGLFVLVVVFVTALCTPGFSQKRSWQLESELANKCLVDGERTSQIYSNNILDKNPNSFSELVYQISDAISQGIVRATFVDGSIATTTTGVVELPAIVSDEMDEDLSTRDNYWSYYDDCDRWGVSFGEFDDHAILYLPTTKKFSSRVAATLNSVLETVGRQFQIVEFQVCECADQYSELLVAFNEPTDSYVEKAVKVEANSTDSSPRIISKLLGQYVGNRPLVRVLKLFSKLGGERIEKVQQFIRTATDGFLTVTRDQISRLSIRANDLF